MLTGYKLVRNSGLRDVRPYRRYKVESLVECVRLHCRRDTTEAILNLSDRPRLKECLFLWGVTQAL